MDYIDITLQEDWDALKDYIIQNNYKTFEKECKANSILLSTDYVPTISFNFQDYEGFILSLQDRESQKDACTWLKQFCIKEEDNTDLIFGKDRTERVVSCEVEGSQVELFIENEDGSITSKFINNNYWILSCIKHGNDWQRLDGNLYYKYIKKYTDRSEYEEDRRNLKKYKPYSIWDAKESAMVLNGFTYFKGMKLEDVSVLSFDIESIGLHHDNDAKVLLISNTFRKKGVLQKKLFSYDSYKTQGEMIQDWCKWVRECNPSVITGYNILNFDLPYIQHVADLEGVNICLGRDGSSIIFNGWQSKHRKGDARIEMYTEAYIYGREIVDLYFLVWKYYNSGKRYESYKLKSIIQEEYDLAIENQENGEQLSDAQKILIDSQVGRQFYDAEQIRYKYKIPEEWEKIKKYCIDDSDDGMNIYNLFMPAYFYYTQSIPKSFQRIICSATGSQLNSLMVRSYLQMNHSIPRDTHTAPFEGGISIGNSGIFKNVFKVDVSSLYPSIILQYEVYDKFKDPFSHFLKIITYFTTKRLKYKSLGKTDLYYKELSEAFKIVINSGFGFMGAPGLNFNSPSNASFITKTGRDVLQKALEWAKCNNLTVVNADTDSISFTKNQEDLTDDERKSLLDNLNSLYPEKIKMADDGYYTDLIVVGAKNYILKKKNAKKPKIKGSGLVASTKPKALQLYIKEFINLLLEGKHDQFVNLYHKYIKEIINIRDIMPWCSRKTISAAVLSPERTTEQKILDSIEDLEDKREGTRVYLYFKEDKSLSLGTKWKKDAPDHDKYKLMQMLWDTTGVFEDIVDIKQFEKYHLKGKRKLLTNIS
jgi:DNA polymerase, archaea type